MTSLIALMLAVAQPPAEKRFTISFENVPWAAALDWFAKESGLMMIATEKPTGTVTIKGDKMTVAEVIDALNAALAKKNFILLRINSTTCALVRADEKISDAYVLPVKPAGQKPSAGEPVLKIYSVSPGTAPTWARVLSEQYADSKLVAVAAIPGKDEVMILAPAVLHAEIAAKLNPAPAAMPCAPVVPPAACASPPACRVVAPPGRPRLLARLRR